MKKTFILTMLLIATFSFKAAARDGFAIVIDPKSYDEAKAAVNAYALAVEQCNNLTTYFVVDRWGVPDSIRKELQRLHSLKKEPIVGCVLIGDIPVAMIRDGQHMTSAFKMDQRRDRRESSVPSDRFYDDFGLKFRSLGRDTALPYFYYSIAPESKQRACPTIYSGRIRPTDEGGVSRYQKLRDFLVKAVEMKKSNRKMSQLFFFSGHGYISGSKVARMDEKISYLEHFPWLKNNRNVISYVDHSDQNPVKERLMNELMRTDLDMAIMHHHGYWDTEYLNGLAPVRTVNEAKQFIMQNLREHLYSAYKKGKNVDSISLVYQKRFDVPASWLKDALNDSLAARDSLDDAATDLHIEDFAAYNYRPNTPVVIIDACFCGSFHLDDCIADEYIFQSGKTVAVVANTVNALQDKWSDHLVGLTSLGGVVGDLPRFSSYLENHLIGDPTFRFAQQEGAVDVDHLVSFGTKADFQKLLKSSQPELQVLAILELAKLKALTSTQLLDIVKNSPFGIVRLQAFLSLADYKDDNYIQAMEIASQDGYELLQRLAIRAMIGSGDERLVPSLIRLAISNNTTERCNFNVLTAMSVYPKQVLMDEFARQFDAPSIQYIRKDSVRKVIARAIENATSRHAPDVDSLFSPNMSEKNQRFILRSMRNQMPHYKVPELIKYFSFTSDEELRITLLELLGWHTNSYQLPVMLEFAKKTAEDTSLSQPIRDEALKTYNRLSGN